MSVTAAQGFEAAGVAVGLKSSGKPDVAVVVNRGPLKVGAAVFTSNRAKANPIIWSQQVVQDGVVEAIVLNSGGANCFTGSFGFQTTHQTAERAAELLGVERGRRADLLDGPHRHRRRGVPREGARRHREGHRRAQRRRRRSGIPRHHDDGLHTEAVRASRGAAGRSAAWRRAPGCWRPGLATMLVVITTDAVIDAAQADAALRSATRITLRPARLRRLHVDERPGDADGRAARPASTPDADDFAAALAEVCSDLARQLQGDAEGASHDIAIRGRARGIRSRCGRGRPLGRPQQPLQGGDLRQRPELGPCARRDRHHRRRVRPVRRRRLDERRPRVQPGRPRRVRATTSTSRPAPPTSSSTSRSATATATILTNDLTHDYVHENSAYAT